MKILQNERKRRSFAIAVVLHAVLLVIFAFVGLTMPDPLPEEIGLPVQLALGETDYGSGEVQPESTETPQENEPIEQEIVEEAAAPEQMATQEAESHYQAPKPVETTPKDEPKPKEEPKLNDKVQNIFKSNPFQSNKNNTSTGQGESNQSGDFGKPDGAPDGKSLSGGLSDGVKGNLDGRSFQGAPKVTSEVQQSGKVVINIIVDRDGNVLRATAGGRGTTITNAGLTQRCIDSARKAKFSPSKSGPEEQPGTLEYIFILR